MDIANLGITVNSTQLLLAAERMKKVGSAANRLEDNLYGFNNGAKQTETTLSRLSDRAQGANKAFKGFSSALQIIGISFAAKEIANLADTWSDLNSRVKLAAGGVKEGADVMGRLSEMAQRTYSPMTQTAETYLRNATAMRELGYSTDETLDFVEAINNAFVVSGIKGQQAESVMNALSKAMAAGKLSGDNLNTVIQSGGRVSEILANYLGVTTTQLSKLGSEGKITGNIIKSALTGELQNLRDAADAMPSTISDGFTLMGNAMLQYIGVLDQAGGVSQGVSESIKWLAENIDVLIKSVGGVAAILTARTFAPFIAGSVESTQKITKQTIELLRGKTAALQQAQALLQLAQAEKAQAQAALQAAQAERARAAASLEAAKAGQLAGVTRAQAMATYVAASKAVSVASVDLAAKSKIAGTTLNSVNTAMKSATITARALAGAAALAGRALSFVGGPIGAAMLALGGAMYFVSSKAQEAQERSDRYAEAIRIAGEKSYTASGGIKQAAKELFSLKKAATSAEQALNIDQSTNEFKAILDAMKAKAAFTNGMYNPSKYGTNIGKFDDIFIDLNKLTLEFEKGGLSAEEYNAKISEIFNKNPKLGWLKDLVALLGTQAKEADAARGAIEGYKAALEGSIDTMRIGRPIGLDQGEILKGAETQKYVDDKLAYLSLSKDERRIIEETNRAKSEAAAQGKELNDQQAREIALKTIADNVTTRHNSSIDKNSKAYSEMSKHIDKTNRDLEIQAQMVGLTGIAADAYRMKMDLLNAAEEQFGKLTPDIIKDANKKAGAYQKLAEAASKTQLQQDLLADRTRMGLSTVEQRVFDAMQQYGLRYGSDAQTQAAIRYNSVLEIGIGYAQNFASTLTSGLVNGTKLTESLGSAFKNLGNQLLSMATNDIINSLFRNLLGGVGGSSGGGFLGSLIGGLGGGGFPAAPSVGLYANGGAFGTGTQRFANGGAFTNSIITSPTPFRFANGGGFSNGLMGEAGPEAVLPLARDAQGRLGVSQHGGDKSSNSAVQNNISVSVQPSKLFDVTVQQTAQETSRKAVESFAKSPQLKQISEGVARSVINNPSRSF